MRRHPFDAHGLVGGVLALGASAWWVLDRTTDLDASLALVLPVGLIVAGLLGVVASLLRRDHPEPAASVDDSPTDSPSDRAGDAEPTTDLTDDTQELR